MSVAQVVMTNDTNAIHKRVCQVIWIDLPSVKCSYIAKPKRVTTWYSHLLFPFQRKTHTAVNCEIILHYALILAYNTHGRFICNHKHFCWFETNWLHRSTRWVSNANGYIHAVKYQSMVTCKAFGAVRSGWYRAL